MLLRFLIICWLCLAVGITPANAQITTPDSGIISVAEYAIIIDYESGQVIYEKNADAPMKPASMAKMMTAYLVFTAIKKGNLSLDDELTISRKARRMGGSRTFLEAGSRVTVSDLLRGMIVQSGNDASVALAEGLAGSEEFFATEMTRVARNLGMKNTVFANSTGWPHPEMTTTARDLAILARAIIMEFPEFYKIYAETSFTHNGITQPNRNPLLYSFEGADGLKTGHTRESGYGLTASAKRGEQRFIMVLNGINSAGERRNESKRLMGLIFPNFRGYTLLAPDRIIAYAPVARGEARSVAVVGAERLRPVLRAGEFDAVKRMVRLNPDIKAPLQKGDKVGEVDFTINGSLVTRDLVAADAVARLSLWRQFIEFTKVVIFGEEALPTPPEYNAAE